MIRFGVMPENVLIFEDSPKGLEAANLTGCNIVQIDSPDDLSSEMIGRHIKLCS